MAKPPKVELHTLVTYRHAVELMARTLIRAENIHVECYRTAYATALWYIYNVPCADAAADLQRMVKYINSKDVASD